jgi:hypothetical protein
LFVLEGVLVEGGGLGMGTGAAAGGINDDEEVAAAAVDDADDDDDDDDGIGRLASPLATAAATEAGTLDPAVGTGRVYGAQGLGDGWWLWWWWWFG